MKQANPVKKYYCCLYHFISGKTNKSSTYCYHHVPLGLINPIKTTTRRFPIQIDQQKLRIEAEANEINNHNHYHNQIEHKQSLPKRLAYPRVYIEQINKKHSSIQDQFTQTYGTIFKNKNFEDIFKLFKKFSKLSHFKTEKQLFANIQHFAKQYNIEEKILKNKEKTNLTNRNQYFFHQKDFINYLINLGFEQSEAQEFWSIAYNQNRFNFFKQKNSNAENKNDIISMKAFAFNYKKIYLEEMQKYSNCLSQKALRQRMIDLRLYLEPWFLKNIIFKENCLKWKDQELEICSYLKRYEQEDIFIKFFQAMEKRNKIWLYMRILSKLIYELTDQKNIGLQIFNQRATSLIQKKKQQFEIFVAFLNHYEEKLIRNNVSKDKYFKITNLIQFIKKQHLQNSQKLTAYLRGLFKYLYFFNKEPLLKMNRATLNLDCEGIVQINFYQLFEYLNYRRKTLDDFMQIVQKICDEVNEIVDSRPEIQGHKKFTMQCNYLAETLLRMIKKCDFTVFLKLEKIRNLYKSDQINQVEIVKKILLQQSIEDEELSKQYWIRLFNFNEENTIMRQTQSQSQEGTKAEKIYKLALKQYQNMKDQLYKNLPKIQQTDKTEPKALLGSIVEKQNKNQKKQISQKNNQKKVQLGKIYIQQHPGSCYCSKCDQICKTNVSETLSNVQSMSDYLMSLLNDI